MTRYFLKVVGVATALGAGLAVSAAMPALTASPTPGNSTPATASIGDTIRAINDAATPPDAVSAFARGLTMDRTNPALYETYIRRMVAFDLPGVAVPAAHSLLAIQPDNGIAWAVLAQDAAQHGDMTNAVSDLVMAVRLAGDDPFVQRTAGYVVAWYDTAPSRAMVPASIQATLDSQRIMLAGKPAFNQAYREARAAYAAASTQPSGALAAAPTSQPAYPGDEYLGPPPAQITNNYYYSSGESEYVPEYDQPWYQGIAYPYFCGYYGPWGFGPTLINVAPFYGHDHHFHAHRDHWIGWHHNGVPIAGQPGAIGRLSGRSIAPDWGRPIPGAVGSPHGVTVIRGAATGHAPVWNARPSNPAIVHWGRSLVPYDHQVAMAPGLRAWSGPVYSHPAFSAPRGGNFARPGGAFGAARTGGWGGGAHFGGGAHSGGDAHSGGGRR